MALSVSVSVRAALFCLMLCLVTQVCGAQTTLTLSDSVRPSGLTDIRKGFVLIAGTGSGKVYVRVTAADGSSSIAQVTAIGGKFSLHYPSDFGISTPLRTGCLFVDAAPDTGSGLHFGEESSAEVTLVVYDGHGVDLPSAFTCGLLDGAGRTDLESAQWPAVHALVNLYMHSRGARLARSSRDGFDLAKPADLAWYKNNLSLYEFDYRDRDWSAPLQHRVRRTFWQGVWNTWFNASNDNPQDGNPNNNTSSNYMAYSFSNDFSDLLIMYAMRRNGPVTLDNNLTAICREGAENLMAMQHLEPTNFAIKDATGRQELYTAGAFRYGMFKNGSYMSEGNGWFTNPTFRDYEAGGVLNGRCVWALGESLKADPTGPLAPKIKRSIGLALKFCLHDGVAGGYVKRTAKGHVYWRDAGEHAYLLLGMLAACNVAPDMPVVLDAGSDPHSLQELCIDALNALVDLEQKGHLWSEYPNVDAMAIAALAEGARLLAGNKSAAQWRTTAMNVADGWMNAKVNPAERKETCVHFGLRKTPDTMTYIWSKGGKVQLFYYQTGHWIHALSDLYTLTGEVRYRQRSEAMIGYLLGDNPFHCRLLNELGGVYNWTDDTDGDGIEDLLKQDMYPESTAFCQIGIMHFLHSLQARAAH